MFKYEIILAQNAEQTNSLWALPSMVGKYAESATGYSDFFNKYSIDPPTIQQIMLSEGSDPVRIRVVEMQTMDQLRELLMYTHSLWTDEALQYYSDQNIVRRFRITDTSTNQVLIDWTEIPHIGGQAFIDWVSATIVG